MIEFKEIRLPDNHGVLQFTVPADLFRSVCDKCTNIQSADFDEVKLSANKMLAGQIEKEIKLHPDIRFRSFLDSMAKTYYEYFEIQSSNFPKLEHCWVNFQKKHEYNPVHAHYGSLSFVIWVKIPYNLENEDAIPHSKNANSKENGRFYILYNSSFEGKISKLRIDLDKSYEGKGIIFPANANHLVYPFFTSDEFRISIAGNFANKPT